MELIKTIEILRLEYLKNEYKWLNIICNKYPTKDERIEYEDTRTQIENQITSLKKAKLIINQLKTQKNGEQH